MKLSLVQLASVIATYVDEQKISVATFTETRDNTVGLLDTIGKIFTIETNFVDKLEMFNGEDLSFGKTVEEWAADLILPENYDASGSSALAPHNSTYRPVYFSYTLGRKKIPQTIKNNDIERAVHNEGQFVKIVESKTKAMYDSETMLKYGIKRELLGVLAERCVAAMDPTNADVTLATEGASISGAHSVSEVFYVTATSKAYVLVKPIASGAGLTGTTAIAGGYLIQYDLVKEIAKPVDTSTGEAFIEQVKADVEKASDFSEGHSLNGNTLGAVPENGLILVMKQGILPNLEVNTFAGAFHEDKVALPTKVVTIPDFGGADSDIYGILLDSRGVRLYNTYRAVRENFNGDGDFLNMFFHTENTAHASRNTYVRVYKVPA